MIQRTLVSVAPPLRPFDITQDLHLLEDYMQSVRKLQYVESSPNEFVTLDYGLTATRDMLKTEQPERVCMHIILNGPVGQMCLGMMQVAGIAADGMLWFDMTVGFISMRDEIALKTEVRRAFDEKTGGDPARIEELLQQQDENTPPDDGDWWKHLPPPEDGD